MARTPTDPTKAQVWITKGLDDLDFEFYFPQGPKGDPGGIVAGAILTSGADLNNILNDGITRWAGFVPNNAPNANVNYATMYTNTTANNSVINQFVLTASTNGSGKSIFIRARDGATWGSWRTLNTTHVDQTSGRAIYQWDDVNNRDQLIYGDTGYRTVNSWFSADMAAGEVLIRRMGSLVSLIFSGTEFTDVSSTLNHSYTGIIPVGFQSSRAIRLPLAPSPGQVTVYGANGNFDVMKGHAAPLYGEIMWTTVNPWPTTLPGTASGTIPNV